MAASYRVGSGRNGPGSPRQAQGPRGSNPPADPRAPCRARCVPWRPCARARVAQGDIDHHVGRLQAAGLLRSIGDVLELELDRLNSLGRALHGLEPGADVAAPTGRDLSAPTDRDVSAPIGPGGEPVPQADAKVLRSFFEGNRLREIPAQDRKRLVVLRYLRDRCFTEDRAYSEKEVNQRIALFHPDVASLRRYMVDSGLMTRAGGLYRRSAP